MKLIYLSRGGYWEELVANEEDILGSRDGCTNYGAVTTSMDIRTEVKSLRSAFNYWSYFFSNNLAKIVALDRESGS